MTLTQQLLTQRPLCRLQRLAENQNDWKVRRRSGTLAQLPQDGSLCPLPASGNLLACCYATLLFCHWLNVRTDIRITLAQGWEDSSAWQSARCVGPLGPLSFLHPSPSAITKGFSLLIASFALPAVTSLSDCSVCPCLKTQTNRGIYKTIHVRYILDEWFLKGSYYLM